MTGSDPLNRKLREVSRERLKRKREETDMECSSADQVLDESEMPPKIPNTSDKKSDSKGLRSEALLLAVKDRRTDRVREFLSCGVPISMGHLERAFTEAASRGHLEIVQIFLDYAESGRLIFMDRALVGAAAHRQAAVVRLLLSYGQQLRNEHLEDAFIAAATAGSICIVDALLDFPLQPSQACLKKAVVAAASKGFCSVIQMMLSHDIVISDEIKREAIASSRDLSVLHFFQRSEWETYPQFSDFMNKIMEDDPATH
jgi:hypothetical protein